MKGSYSTVWWPVLAGARARTLHARDFEGVVPLQHSGVADSLGRVQMRGRSPYSRLGGGGLHHEP